MSTYNGRRGVNVSQYIANLNTVDPQPTDDLSPQGDLSLFATTDFFDFDMGDQLPGQVSGTDFGLKSSTSAWQAPAGDVQPGFLDDFNFDSLATFNPAPFSLDTTSPTSATSPSSALPRGEKRKATTDETARVAAEEDKRRRNTAASARFRVKKKQREQALEKTAKEMTEKATMLETKVQQLEMENKWLKGLITERDVGGAESGSVGLGKGELRELYEKYRSTVPSIATSSISEVAKGVGTADEEDEFEDDE